MTEAILLAIQAVSFVVIVIIMAVMANTMAMTARERYGEYATLKALGFGNGFVALLIFGESLRHRAARRRARHRAHVSARRRVRQRDGHAVPGASACRDETMVMQVGAALAVGVVAAAVPGVARGARAHRRRPARDGVTWRR